MEKRSRNRKTVHRFRNLTIVGPAVLRVYFLPGQDSMKTAPGVLSRD